MSTRDDADDLEAMDDAIDDAMDAIDRRPPDDGRAALTLVRPSREPDDDGLLRPVDALRAHALALGAVLRRVAPPLSASDAVYVDRVACDMLAACVRVPSPALRAAAARIATRCRELAAPPDTSPGHDARVLAALLDGVRLAAVVFEEQSHEALRQMLRASLGTDGVDG